MSPVVAPQPPSTPPMDSLNLDSPTLVAAPATASPADSDPVPHMSTWTNYTPSTNPSSSTPSTRPPTAEPPSQYTERPHTHYHTPAALTNRSHLPQIYTGLKGYPAGAMAPAYAPQSRPYPAYPSYPSYPYVPHRPVTSYRPHNGEPSPSSAPVHPQHRADHPYGVMSAPPRGGPPYFYP